MAYLSSIEASDCSVVRKLAEQAFGRSVHDVLPLGGLIAHNFMVDNQRVFKVASSRSCVDDWQRLVANAPVLQQHLSVQIPIPTLHILKHGSEQIPAISYERLPGFCMSRAMFAEKDDAFKKNYFSQLSEKIHELHQVSPDVLPARPLTVLQQAVNMLFNNKTARNLLVTLHSKAMKRRKMKNPSFRLMKSALKGKFQIKVDKKSLRDQTRSAEALLFIVYLLPTDESSF